jgi:hypothetical protein
MNNLKKIILISLLSASSLTAVAGDFFYKSKQSNETLTRYNQVVTGNSLIESIKIIKKEDQKTVMFKNLQNKENPETKYNGIIEVNITKGEFNKDILLNLKDSNKNKNLILNVQTNNEESILEKFLSSNKGDVLSYLDTSNFNVLIENSNNTSFIFELLDIKGKKSLFDQLIKLNSNKVLENITLSKNKGEEGEFSYKMNIENILDLNINSTFLFSKNKIHLKDIMIEINVIEEIKELNDFKEIFNIEMKKGLNKKEIKEFTIKL